MKKLISSIAILTVLLIGCATHNGEAEQEERFEVFYSQNNESITIDKETGCKYFNKFSVDGVGTTHLLKSDGTPDCD